MLIEEARHYEKDEMWSQHLEWLLENKPDMVRRLFEKDKGKLRLLISQRVKQALLLWDKLQKEGELDANEIQEVILSEVIAPPPPGDSPEPLPEHVRLRILRWADNLTEQRIATTSDDVAD